MCAASMEAVGWGSGDVAENTDWARGIAVEYGQRMYCRIDRVQSRTNDGTRLLWVVYTEAESDHAAGTGGAS